jgi:hypothetical protein
MPNSRDLKSGGHLATLASPPPPPPLLRLSAKAALLLLPTTTTQPLTAKLASSLEIKIASLKIVPVVAACSGRLYSFYFFANCGQ